MASLLFRQPPQLSGDLVFGEVENLPDAEAQLYAVFPFTFSAGLGTYDDATLTGVFPGLSFLALATYDPNVDRPEVGASVARHQDATPAYAGAAVWHQDAREAEAGAASGWARARIIDAQVKTVEGDAIRSGAPAHRVHYTAAQRGGQRWRAGFAGSLRDRRQALTFAYVDAEPAGSRFATAWQERYRDRRPLIGGRWAQATGLGALRRQGYTTGKPVRVARHPHHKEAMRPPPGVVTIVVPPIDPRCYLPDANLRFVLGPAAPALLFVCAASDYREPLFIPVRRAYIVINDVELRRVVDNILVPNDGFSLAIDADSWAWGFSATLPGSALDAVDPDDGPVLLAASVNGHTFNVLAETVTSERSFGQHQIKVSGRSRTALLAAPWAPKLTRRNLIERSAEQLMGDVLEFNGVTLPDWSVDWRLDDWLVPAGAWHHQGTYMDGLLAIVGAAGGYLQPHPTDHQVIAMPRYPVAPWGWAGAVLDFELPSAVTLQEGIQWVDKPAYNRVYVSGEAYGVLGRVTRDGTAGELAAPMVTDPLITAAAAARQRGMAILGDTGAQAWVRLRTPIMDPVGVVQPGALVRYVDGGLERIGLVRSTQIAAGFPTAWQTLELETHRGGA